MTSDKRGSQPLPTLFDGKIKDSMSEIRSMMGKPAAGIKLSKYSTEEAI
jgi:hypothetical protein